MIKRLTQVVPPWLIAFSGCAIAVLGAMGWITHRALTLEIAEAQARADATRQEAVRLALWRMDSWMTSLIAREAARPYFHYLSFYPADRPYAFYSAEMSVESLGAADKVSPSPLLTTPPQDVKLFFQIWPDGRVTSPQVPSGGLRGLALLADANDSAINAAASTLNELTDLLGSGAARVALGVPDATFSDRAGAPSRSDPLSALALNERPTPAGAPAPVIGGGQPTIQVDSPPGAQTVGSVIDDQNRLDKAKQDSVQTSSAAPRQTAQTDQNRAPQQVETDGKQPWQASNDYEARQQVAETTRNIAQNRAPAYGNPQVVQPSNPQSGTSSTTVASAPVNTPVNTPGNSPADAARKENKSATGEGGNAEQSDNKKLATGAAVAGAPEKLATDHADDSQHARTRSEKPSATPPPGSAAGAPAGSGTPQPPPPNADPGNLELKKSAEVSKEAPVRVLEASGKDASPNAITLNEAGPGGALDSTRDLTSKTLSDFLRAGSSDSYPVVVRSLAVEPTPLITACLPAPTHFNTTAESAARSISVASSTAQASFNLFLTRQVPLDTGRVLQGMWLDWPMLRTNLLALSQDLLPGATLELCAPMSPTAATAESGLMLASIPAKLVLPPATSVQISRFSLLTGDTWSPTRIAIIGGWIAVLGGIFAIGWVLRQSVQLGERRGRFVSAVTHELRTPLTTFALYSQMLADGMVQDPEAQREYHQTLRKESDRLSRIVESVLDYARLGKRRSDSNGQVIRPAINAADLINTIEPHLRSRASVSGLELIVDTPDLSAITLRAERDSIERILENLVENAGKYAAGHGTDQRLHLIATLDGRWLHLDIADHGPGIASGEARRVFAPFERGKAQQDGSKPGLGLGLAFARGLARDLGGDLILLAHQPGFGATFRLKIPAEIMPRGSATSPDLPGAEGPIEGQTGGQNPESAASDASHPENRPQ